MINLDFLTDFLLFPDLYFSKKNITLSNRTQKLLHEHTAIHKISIHFMSSSPQLQLLR